MSPLLSPAPARSIQWCASLQPGSYGFSSQKQVAGITLSNNQLRAMPVYFHRAVIIDRFGCEVMTAGQAGSTIRLGVYADTGNLHPGTLLAELGIVTADSIAIKELTIDQYVPAGVVWFAAVAQGGPVTPPNARGASGSPPLASILPGDVASSTVSYIQNSVTGALPAAYTDIGIRSGVWPRVFWRVKP